MAGIYVHIPFCHAKCAYCDFYSVARHTELAMDYVDAIIAEHHVRGGETGSEPIHTIYIGGGTPSSLPPDALGRLLEHFARVGADEFTVEVNPEDVSPALVSQLVDAGVNRVSMGVQSLCDNELRAVCRRHSAEEAVMACRCLQDGGVKNISLDLIYGLPQQTDASWENSVNGILSLNPQHISAYALSYEPGTRLTAALQAGRISATDDESMQRRYAFLCHALAEAGFRHYEISNFARPDFISRHNSSYWELTPYLGLGCAAHSLDTQGIRRYNPNSLKEYIAASPGSCACIDSESPSERINDYIMMRLRTDSGLSLSAIGSLFGYGAEARVRKRADKLLRRNLLAAAAESSSLRIPERLWLVSDSIIVDLFE